MPGKIYLNLLILCGIWSQRIFGSFADENITESSSFLARQKRVISQVAGEDVPIAIEDRPYIVIIKLHNRIHCVGTILSNRVILSTADCVATNIRSNYKITSESSRSNRVVRAHNVTDIKFHYGNHPNRTSDGIALITIYPAIVYNARSNKIDLHVGPVLPGMIGTVYGWGYNSRNITDPGTQIPLHLRSIKVPIMVHRDCVNRYREFYQISDLDICTFDPYKRAGHNDAGAPLILDNSLVGIFLRRGPVNYPQFIQYPDVFVFLPHIYYSRWILANI